jgi:hypothetical protein
MQDDRLVNEVQSLSQTYNRRIENKIRPQKDNVLAFSSRNSIYGVLAR